MKKILFTLLAASCSCAIAGTYNIAPATPLSVKVLDDAWNKDLLPHQGRHPNAYHEYVLDSMKQFDNIAQGDKDIFLKLFDNLTFDNISQL